MTPYISIHLQSSRRRQTMIRTGLIISMYTQKQAFVEFFIPSSDWRALHRKLQDIEDVSYYAGNSEGEFVCSDADSVNAVTWGAFTGKEYVPYAFLFITQSLPGPRPTPVLACVLVQKPDLPYLTTVLTIQPTRQNHLAHHHRRHILPRLARRSLRHLARVAARVRQGLGLGPAARSYHPRSMARQRHPPRLYRR